MKTTKIISLIVVFQTTIVQAQTTGEKIEKTGQQVESVVETINSIKSLFKKKDKTREQTTTKNEVTKGIFNLGSGLSKPSVYKAGAISKNVKYIDCDEIRDFNRGAAIIKKGNSFALINSQGEFIVPFNKYSEISETKSLSKSGIFRVNNWNSDYSSLYEGYINSEGLLLIGGEAAKTYIPSEDGKHLVSITENKTSQTSIVSVIDSKGNKKNISIDGLCSRGYHGSTYIQDSVIVFNKIIANKTRYGFKTVSGFGTTASFETLSNFSYGVAEFSKTDEFGKVKYGFINKKGQIIFPAKLAYKQGPFRAKHIVLKASQDADFESAIIDLTGKIIYKNTKESETKAGNVLNADDWFVYSGKAILNEKGELYTQQDFFQKIGVSIGPNSQFKSGYFTSKNMGWDYDDNNQRFTVSENNSILDNIQYNGLYNVKTGKVLLVRLLSDGLSGLNWNGLDRQIMFDNESGLARVTLHTDKKDKNNRYIGINGYIDGDGVVRIIRETKKSDW
ncbi:WG repeat-containing protein [Pedobacter sp.]